MLHRIGTSALFFSLISTVLMADVVAEQSISRREIGREVRALAAVRSKGGANTRFPGSWSGRFGLVRSTCSGFPASLSFRHAISMSGNRVRIVTSHDGSLLGISRDKGRRLEAVRQYQQNGVTVSVAVIYGGLSNNTATVGLGVDLRRGNNVCQASYRATAFR